MNFKKRKIRNHFRQLEKKRQQEQPVEKTVHTHQPQETHLDNVETPLITKRHNDHSYINWITVGAGLLLVFGLFWITVGLVKSLDFGSVVFSFGKELKKDTGKQTNFLLAGVGGAEHEGGNLTDTIIVASLDERTKKVKMLSIPRDLYIDSKQLGGQRINKIYDTYLNQYDEQSPEAMRAFSEEITSITGVPIHYYVKVDFGGFVKIVDALGGVTMNIPKRIYDPSYPLGETIRYTTFSIEAGLQTLDGETALKYARSRHTTSDFDRAERQHNLLAAIKDKAFSLNILTDPTKIQALYDSVADSIETNLSVAEIIELAKISKDIPKDSIDSRVITDDFTSCGGFLYTPNRDYFGGAAVLLPAGNNFDEIRRFTQSYFASKDTTTPEIQVLNGTKTTNLALNYLNRLSRDCLNVVYYGNASDRALANSSIYYNPIIDEGGTYKIPDSVAQVKSTIDAPIVEGIPADYLVGEKRANSQIVIELGADYKSITTPDAFSKLLYTAPTPKPATPPAEPVAEKPLNSAATTTTDKPSTPAEKTPTEPVKPTP